MPGRPQGRPVRVTGLQPARDHWRDSDRERISSSAAAQRAMDLGPAYLPIRATVGQIAWQSASVSSYLACCNIAVFLSQEDRLLRHRERSNRLVSADASRPLLRSRRC